MAGDLWSVQGQPSDLSANVHKPQPLNCSDHLINHCIPEVNLIGENLWPACLSLYPLQVWRSPQCWPQWIPNQPGRPLKNSKIEKVQPHNKDKAKIAKGFAFYDLPWECIYKWLMKVTQMSRLPTTSFCHHKITENVQDDFQYLTLPAPSNPRPFLFLRCLIQESIIPLPPTLHWSLQKKPTMRHWQWTPSPSKKTSLSFLLFYFRACFEAENQMVKCDPKKGECCAKWNIYTLKRIFLINACVF